MRELESSGRASSAATGARGPAGTAPTGFAAIPAVTTARTAVSLGAPSHPAAATLARLSSSVGLPARAFLAALGLSAMSSFIAFAALVRDERSVAALEEGSDAPAAEADQGVAAGVREAPASASAKTSAPSEPTRRASHDGQPEAETLRALAKSEAATPAGYARALGAVRELLELGPDQAADPDVTSVVRTVAIGPESTAAPAFELMASHMGMHGPDLLFAISSDVQVPRAARERATALLADGEVRRLASPALLVALELRQASICGRRALLERARQHGDQRALASLHPMLVATGCGNFRKTDCYPCLGSRSDVRTTIAAIHARGAAGMQAGQTLRQSTR